MKFGKYKVMLLLLGLIALCAVLLTACKKCETHQWEEISNTATCTEPGVITSRCSVCGEEMTTKSPALGHDWDSESIEVLEASTCTKAGKATHKCARCSQSEEYDLPLAEHNYRPDFINSVVATCTKPGLDIKICRNCQNRQETELEPLGHDFTGTAVVVKEATCLEEGERRIQCKRAGCDGDGTNTPAVKSLAIEPLGHNWQTGSTIDKEPTFAEEGSRSVHCLRCEETKDRQSIPKLVENEPVEYKFRVARCNGETIQTGLSAITLNVYDSEGDVVATSSRSNFANGIMTVSLVPADYTVKIEGLPDGYHAESEYAIAPGSLEKDLIVTASLLPAEQANNNTKYGKGSVLHDYTFTDVRSRQSVTLSELLEQKKIVLLNFFFSDCSACQSEMPGLISAYNIYKDEIAIVMLDVVPYDTPQKIRDEFLSPFNVPDTVWTVQDLTPNNAVAGATYNNICEKFGFQSAPQNVIIDQEGVVVYVHQGATSEMEYRSIFQQYTSAPYYIEGESTAIQHAILPEKEEY